jgi:hypothetical protein
MDRFDLEQQIMDCWRVVDDLKILTEHTLEGNLLDCDKISNITSGLAELYQLKFDKLFHAFEDVVRDEWTAKMDLDRMSQQYNRLLEKTELLYSTKSEM